MGYNEFVGARYVPLIDGQWDSVKAYEPLTVVLYQGASYTSKKTVPAGTLPTDGEYWALTGDYNAQVANYKSTVDNLASDLEEELAAEAVARAAADLELREEINTKVNAEKNARQNKDIELESQIGTVRVTNNQRYTSLNNRMATHEEEVAADLAAQDSQITALETNIAAEMNAFQQNTSAQIATALANAATPVIVEAVSDMVDTTKFYILKSNSHIYVYKNNAWTDTGVVYGADFSSALTNNGSLPDGADLNGCTTSGWYGLVSSRTYVNSPIAGAGTLVVYGWGQVQQQILYVYLGANNGAMYCRRHSNEGWTEWIDRTAKDKEAVLNLRTSGYDVINYQPGSISEQMAARPNQTTGFVLMKDFPDNADYPTEINNPPANVIKLGAPSAVSRSSLLSMEVGPVRLKTAVVETDGTIKWAAIKGGLYSTMKVAFFGDSIVAGRDGSAAAGVHVSNTITQICEAALGCLVDNFGVGSQGWAAEGSDGFNAYGKIQDTDLTGYDVAVLMYGLNDTVHTLGTYLDTVDDTTIMGHLNKAVTYLAETYPDVSIIIVTPNLTRRGNFPEWSRAWKRAGGWDQNEMNEQIRLYCERYNMHYVDGSAAYNAYNVQTLIGDWVHPTEQGYKVLGNYIAAQLGKFI